MYALALIQKLSISSPKVHTIAGNVVMGNQGILVVNKASGAATQATLPARAKAGDFAFVVDGKGDAATYNITVIPDATTYNTTINGGASVVISENYGSVLLMHNGSEWNVIVAPNLSATELAFLNGVVAGTGAVSKALVLDSSGGVTLPAGGFIDERNAEVVITTNVITAAENGKTFYLSLAAGFTSTLPAPAIGLKFTFIVKTAPTTAYIILTTASANILYGHMLERAGGAGVAGAARDTFNFVANQSIIGDWVEFHSDGTNWYYHGIVDVAAGNTVAQAS